ncbi:hypothetical protein [Qipengyuania sp.]|uniref:hypothetical protein n=1 Tax=Qipengyuania sp. TaxID=2004515 RepID=UPI003734CAB6
MSVLAALALAAAPAAEPVALAADQIVVIGERLKTWRGKWRTDKGAARCQTTKSTGDREIDAIGCSALEACVTPLIPRMQAIAASKAPRAERNRLMQAASQPIGPCLVERRGDGIAALAERRAGA